jgi:hypothetical protein
MTRTMKTLRNISNYFLGLSFKDIFKFMAYTASVTVINLVSLSVYNGQIWIYRIVCEESYIQ